MDENESSNSSGFWTSVRGGITFLMHTARESLKNAKTPEDLLRFVRYPSPNPSGIKLEIIKGGPCTIFACRYPSTAHLPFLEDFQSIGFD
jgi:hypothetical protein